MRVIRRPAVEEFAAGAFQKTGRRVMFFQGNRPHAYSVSVFKRPLTRKRPDMVWLIVKQKTEIREGLEAGCDKH